MSKALKAISKELGQVVVIVFVQELQIFNDVPCEVLRIEEYLPEPFFYFCQDPGQLNIT